jgi:hypothetical protein
MQPYTYTLGAEDVEMAANLLNRLRPDVVHMEGPDYYRRELIGAAWDDDAPSVWLHDAIISGVTYHYCFMPKVGPDNNVVCDIKVTVTPNEFAKVSITT